MGRPSSGVCGVLPQTKGEISRVAKPRPKESQRLRKDAAHDEVPSMLRPPPPVMCGPPLSSSMLVVAKNEDETRGLRGCWAALDRATMI